MSNWTKIPRYINDKDEYTIIANQAPLETNTNGLWQIQTVEKGPVSVWSSLLLEIADIMEKYNYKKNVKIKFLRAADSNRTHAVEI